MRQHTETVRNYHTKKGDAAYVRSFNRYVIVPR